MVHTSGITSRTSLGRTTKCKTKAFYVPELQQDLLAGRALLNAVYRVILDNDPRIAGFFPLTNGER